MNANLSKSALYISALLLMIMACAQLVLYFHPDQKEFADSFKDIASYKEALPEYHNNPLTHLREWWVNHFMVLKIIAGCSLVVSGLSAVSLLKNRTKAQQIAPGDAKERRA